MRSKYHIERDFSSINYNFIWFEYHQIRFISFAIWFIGLFLTDFTSIISTPIDGWNDVLTFIKVTSIIHVIFVAVFFINLIYQYVTNIPEKKPSSKLIIGSLFDLSIHFDVAALIFTVYFQTTSYAIIAIEIIAIIDAILTFILTPFKKWRSFICIFGVLPSLILGHISIYRKISYVAVFLPITLICAMPLVFAIIVNIPKRMPPIFRKLICFIDPTLLPNLMTIPFARVQIPEEHHVNAGGDPPPTIHEKATSGSEFDYFDFKSFPFFIAATFFIHFGCYCQGMHKYVIVVMCHYFLMLASFLVNSRVVSFPAIVLTNVQDKSVEFNSVWPELSFV